MTVLFLGEQLLIGASLRPAGARYAGEPGWRGAGSASAGQPHPGKKGELPGSHVVPNVAQCTPMSEKIVTGRMAISKTFLLMTVTIPIC